MRKHCTVITFIVLALFMFSGCASRDGVDGRLDSAWWSVEDINTESAPYCRGIVRTSQYVAMPDGVRLAVDIYLPENLSEGARLPTIMMQTRYWRRIDLRWPARAFVDYPPEELTRIVESGYALVRLDARGTGASFGSRSCPWSADEVSDGAHIADWIIKQPWSDGKIGSAGGSYEGTTSEFLATTRHPAVKCVAPMFALYDVYTDIAYPGGIHLEWFTRTWQAGNHAMDVNRPQEVLWWAPLATRGVSRVDVDKDGEFLRKAVEEHAANYAVNDEALQINYRDDVSSGGLCMDNFSPHVFADRLRESNAAVYNYSGWFDGGYPHAAIKRFLTVRNPGSRLILGPWDHGGDDHVRPFSKTVKAKFDHVGELLRFFDHHLKGIDNGIEKEPPVRYYTMVEDKWKSSDTWPPENTHAATFFLGDKKSLQKEMATDADADAFLTNRDIGSGEKSRWRCLAKEMAVNYGDRRDFDDKLLSYTSPPLTRDTEVTGHPIVTLYISSDKTDAQVFVYLEDVDESGRVAYVTEGLLRAMHRKIAEGKAPYNTPAPFRTFTKADAAPLVPGEVAELKFDLLPVSYLFKKGHALRITVSGADKDHFRFLPGDPPRINIHRSKPHPSQIELPVVE